MTNERKIQSLQQLLSRVQSNVARPRPARSAPVPAAAIPDVVRLDGARTAIAEAKSPPPPPVAAVETDDAPSIDIVVEENIDLLDEEIIEITDAGSIPPPAAAAAPPVDATAIDFDEDEEAPASSRRAKVASTMDEALAAAAGGTAEVEHEVPVKTPPPESGPQEAAPPAEALAPARVPEVRQLDDSASEFEIMPRRPSAEQIGQTVDLGSPSRAQLELKPASSAPPPTAPDELEAALPKREVAVAPPSAEPAKRVEVPAPAPAPKPEPVSKPAAVVPAPAPAAQPAEAAPSAPIVAEVAQRPEIAAAAPVAITTERKAFKPQTFLELLDASLGLGR